MKTVVWIGRYVRGGFAPGARRNVKALLPYVDKLIVAPLYVLPEDHELYPFVEDFDEGEGDFFKVVNHLPITDPTADAYYSVFEFDQIPPQWAEIFDNAKLIMTESHFCKEIFSKQVKDPSKIHVIPYILPKSIREFDPHGKKFRPWPSDQFVFGNIFEWVPRKVHERTIIAFLNEFLRL